MKARPDQSSHGRLRMLARRTLAVGWLDDQRGHDGQRHDDAAHHCSFNSMVRMFNGSCSDVIMPQFFMMRTGPAVQRCNS